MTKRFTKQTAWKSISKRLRRLKSRDSKDIMKYLDFLGKCLAESMGLDYDPKTVPCAKIQY